MAKQQRKLVLAKETVKNLSPNEMQANVVGGFPWKWVSLAGPVCWAIDGFLVSSQICTKPREPEVIKPESHTCTGIETQNNCTSPCKI